MSSFFIGPILFLGIWIELLNRKNMIKRKLIFNKVWILIHSAVRKFQIRIAQIGTFLKFLWSSYDELSIYLSQCGKPSMGLAKNGSQNGKQRCMPRFTQRIAIKWRKKQKGDPVQFAINPKELHQVVVVIIQVILLQIYIIYRTF